MFRLGSFAFALLAITIVVLLGSARVESQDERPQTQATMRALFQSLTTAYNYGLDAEAFRDPDNHEAILYTLRTLSANASRLDEHTYELDPSYDYLRRSLARDAREAADRFDAGQFAGSWFLLNKMTENCVACHSRLPSDTEFQLGKYFVEQVNVQSLSTEDQIRLEVTTRQFDKALSSYEELFASPNSQPDALALTGAFDTYMELCVRVKNDFNRPRAVFEEVITREDTPRYLEQQLLVWIEALQTIKTLETPRGGELSRARALIDEGRGLNRFPADRLGMVHFAAASGVLHILLQNRPDDGMVLAEAYYLLGVAESSTAPSYWISETEFFLERAIRAAPKSTYGRRAYELLEAYTVEGYSGSAGESMPEDVRAHLDELRDLIGD